MLIFEKIFDFIVGAIDKISPVFIIDQTELGIIKRFGIYQRLANPGLRWKIPFLEVYETETVVLTTLNLSAQTLTTYDDRSIVITAIVAYSINDIAKYLLNMYDGEEVLADITMGAIQEQVAKTSYVDIFEVQDAVLPLVRKKLRDFGIKIKTVTFIDLGAVRSIRLIQDN